MSVSDQTRPQFTRTERRQKQLADRIDRIAVADCEYLAARNREYRIRRAFSAEIEQMELATGAIMLMPPGRALFAVIKRVAVETCVCLRMYLENDARARTGRFTEATCRELFEQAVPPEALLAEADYIAGGRP